MNRFNLHTALLAVIAVALVVIAFQLSRPSFTSLGGAYVLNQKTGEIKLADVKGLLPIHTTIEGVSGDTTTVKL